MTPIDWALRPLHKYAVFSGRAPRAEYWWYTLAVFVLLGLAVLIERFSGLPRVVGVYGPVSLAALFCTFTASIAVQVRRLHDLNWSGAWLFAIYVPQGLATAGPLLGIPAALVGIFSFILLAASFFGLVLFVRRGTEGPNDYGPDPYGADELEEVFA